MDHPGGLRQRFTKLKTQLTAPFHSAPLPAPYEYHRLPTDAGTAFIRVFELVPSDSSTLLEGRLIDIDIATTPPPSYDALSYSWGRDVLTSRLYDKCNFISPTKFPRYRVERLAKGDPGRPILCDGRTLHTQPNLHDFLVRMARHPTRSRRRIWIDAICIQQDDHDDAAKQEKLRQLSIIGRIYRCAETVHVWLGESKHLSAGFPEYLRKLGPMFDVEEYVSYRHEHDILDRLAQSRKGAERVLHVSGVELGDSMLAMLAKLLWARKTKWAEPSKDLIKVLARDYFQRAWVVPEMVLARQMLFLIGNMEILPDHLLRGVRVIEYMEAGSMSMGGTSIVMQLGPHRGHSALPHLLKAGQDTMTTSKGRGWDFADFLFLCRDREASLPKDKVVSLLGLVDEGLAKTLMGYVQQDEGQDAFTHTYVGCAVELAERRGWPYVLQMVGRPLQLPDGKEEPEPQTKERPLPSWVPDLRTPLLPKPFDYFGCAHYRAATNVEPVFELIEGRTGPFRRALSISVAVIDTIAQVGEPFDELGLFGVSRTPFQGHMLDLVARIGYEYPPAKRMGRWELTMDVFLRTLTGDVFKRQLLIQDRLGRPSTKLRRQFMLYLSEICIMGHDRLLGTCFRQLVRKTRATCTQSSRSIARVATAAQLNKSGPIDFSETLMAFIVAHQSNAYPLMQELLGLHNYVPSAEGEAQPIRKPLLVLRKMKPRQASRGLDRNQGREYEAHLRCRMDSETTSSPFELQPQSKRGRDVSRQHRRSASVPPLVLPDSSSFTGKTTRHALRHGKRFGHTKSPADPDVDEAYDSDSNDDSGTFNGLTLLKFLLKDKDVPVAITSILRDRRVFRTEKHNFLGVSHDCIRNGDVVALVAGVATPFVFRRVSGVEDVYALVGSAYVHGIMYGELMEPSPLLAKFERMTVV
ncbi:hypothetical protein OQA88_11660 [Cercophora sp. LCS_1]